MTTQTSDSGLYTTLLRAKETPLPGRDYVTPAQPKPDLGHDDAALHMKETNAQHILKLPNEILEEMFSYLDWDPQISVTPYRPDIENISLTCHQLRSAVLPLLFRHVRLVLRWDVASLLEPKLFHLRKVAPHLMKWVRTVHIETRFGHVRNSHGQYEPFSVPNNLQDWLDPSETVPADYPAYKRHAHRQRVEEVARELLESDEYKIQLQQCTPELWEHLEALVLKLFGATTTYLDGVLQQRPSGREPYAQATPDLETTASSPMLVAQITPRTERQFAVETGSDGLEYPLSHRRQLRDIRMQLDALVLVMLCLPPTVRSLVIQNEPITRRDSLQSRFALHVTAAAFKIFGGSLEALAMMMVLSPEEHGWSSVVQVPILEGLQAVRQLTLDLNQDNSGAARPGLNGSRNLPAEATCWHVLRSVTQLSLLDVSVHPPKVIEIVKGFAALRKITLNGIRLTRVGQVGARQREEQHRVWLELLIEIRRNAPLAAIELVNMKGCNAEDIRESAQKWLLQQAVPVGCNIDVQREIRLEEDFESFVPLWLAEDSIRGELAKQERKDGKLVDSAMLSRWRGLV